jgi:hypothetical protein
MTSAVNLRCSPDDDRRRLILRCDHPRESTNEHDSVNSCNLDHGQVKLEATKGSEGKLGHEGKGGEIIRLPPTSQTLFVCQNLLSVTKLSNFSGSPGHALLTRRTTQIYYCRSRV